MEPFLGIVFSSVFIGRIKGTSRDRVKFTTKNIQIPFQVALGKNVSLSVDTIHLKKFGLWKNKNHPHCKTNNTVIFLWTTSDYVKEIETQLGYNVLSQPSKSNEFIFLELQKPISGREEVKFKEVMAEVKKKHRSVALSEPLFWNEALPLFQHFLLEECSFLHYLYCSFQLEQQQQQKADSVLVKNQPLPQHFQETYRAVQGERMTCPKLEEVKRIPQNRQESSGVTENCKRKSIGTLWKMKSA
ncbi:sentrin-specific protease 7-like [Ornithorhynchus anatinus]|uniref:sentrin-specific protease 7-like n=1 Tax=Ornithorhynchus anatinus TaxID=9258 RepID=UPI00028F3934|nr:sentrin-specific protease 7-like [Ornithorhynchus anatinus]